MFYVRLTGSQVSSGSFFFFSGLLIGKPGGHKLLGSFEASSYSDFLRFCPSILLCHVVDVVSQLNRLLCSDVSSSKPLFRP
jgi:hypothetical protein